jgi:hypothetical protein
METSQGNGALVVIRKIKMLNITQELSAAVAEGNHWLVHNEADVLGAFSSRNKARDAKGENKIKQWDGKEGFNLLNGHTDDSIQGVVDAAQAVGMNVTVIDENTDFSQLGNPFGTSTGRFPSSESNLEDVEKSASDKAFDQPHHGHMDDAEEFAEAKEAGVEVTDLKTKPIDPAKEAKPKRELLHKSTVEKPTRLVHAIADMLAEIDPKVTRKEIIEACTAEGIAHYTILTQYQAWRSSRNA